MPFFIAKVQYRPKPSLEPLTWQVIFRYIKAALLRLKFGARPFLPFLIFDYYSFIYKNKILPHRVSLPLFTLIQPIAFRSGGRIQLVLTLGQFVRQQPLIVRTGVIERTGRVVAKPCAPVKYVRKQDIRPHRKFCRSSAPKNKRITDPSSL